MKADKITIYTDGAARGNPGPAGWGAVILTPSLSALPLSKGERNPPLLNKEGQGVVEIGGRVDHATNNQMELTAAIEALKYVKKKFNPHHTSPLHKGEAKEGVTGVEIISDSKYVILGITEWIQDWIQNGWKNAAKRPVLNRGLWEELYALAEAVKPKWVYVKGHNEDRYNDRADLIATSFADGEPVKLKK